MKRRKETAPVAEYLAAFLAPALIGVIVAVTWPGFEEVSVTVYLFAVIFCAWYGGIVPGLLSLLNSFLIADYFFIQPYYAFWPVSQNSAIRLTILVAVGTSICVISELMHRATRRAEAEFDELKQVEAKLQQSEASLINAQRIANIGNWDLAFETNDFSCSRQIFEIFGIDNPETDNVYDALMARVHPDDRERLLAAKTEASAGRESLDLEYRIVRPDGSERNAHVLGEVTVNDSGQPLGLRGTVIDITGRKRDEEVLLESQERYKLLFENNPCPMWVFDIETLEFLAVNYAATLNYGYSREEFMDMTIKDIRPPEYVRDLQETVSSVRGRLKSAGIWKHRKKDGHVFDAEITSHELIFAGRPSRLVLANDVTARERARLDIQRLNEELEQRVFDRTAELQVANKELESFSYSVSHDLRAPLRHINGFGLALLEDYSDVLDETGKNYLREVRGASQEMSLLIDDILELARVSRSEMTREPIDLSKLAHSIMNDLQKSNPDRILAVEIENGLSTHGDRRLIQIMLTNLLGNAWKFTSKTTAAEIAFGTQVVSGQTHYFVRDNGAGFDMKYVDKLFGAFQRLHNASEFEGTGIGLATVQRIVHRHGGRVWAEGSVNAGASFYFTLPGPREVINGHQNHTID